MDTASGAGARLPVDLVVLVATLVYVVVGWIVGVRLLRLARRTRGLPELTLGLGECLLAGAVPPFFVIVQAVPEAGALVRAAAFAGHLAYTLGCAVMIVFTWRVFRPDATWARALGPVMIGILLFGGVLGMARALLVADATELREPQTSAFLLMEWVSVAGFLWTTVEAFQHHGRLRRQAALGLADPVLVNRMLLWALVGVAGVLAAGAPVVAALCGLSAADHVPTRLACASGTLASSVFIQLAFVPPKGYLRWVRSGARV
jgi:hypothetical protein